MTLQIIGHAGARVLAFPTSMGTHSEWPDRRMHLVLQDHIDQGWIQLFCLDQPHHENWGNEAVHAGHRAWVHLQYYSYVRDEVLPFTAIEERQPLRHHHRGEPRRHSRRGLRPPLSGIGESDPRHERALRPQAPDRRILATPICTRCNPMDFMRHEHDPLRLDAFRRQDIIFAIGEDDPVCDNNREFSALLWGKGIGNALRHLGRPRPRLASLGEDGADSTSADTTRRFDGTAKSAPTATVQPDFNRSPNTAQ